MLKKTMQIGLAAAVLTAGMLIPQVSQAGGIHIRVYPGHTVQRVKKYHKHYQPPRVVFVPRAHVRPKVYAQHRSYHKKPHFWQYREFDKRRVRRHY